MWIDVIDAIRAGWRDDDAIARKSVRGGQQINVVNINDVHIQPALIITSRTGRLYFKNDVVLSL
jgi:hypothetical protein